MPKKTLISSKEIGPPVNTLRHHLQTPLAIAHVRLLIAEWHLFWHRESGFGRQSQKRSIKQAENFILERCPWMKDAIILQQRCREAITASSRKTAVLHIESITVACDETEALLPLPSKSKSTK